MSSGLQPRVNDLALQGQQGVGIPMEAMRPPEDPLNILRMLQQRMGLIIVMAIIGLVRRLVHPAGAAVLCRGG